MYARFLFGLYSACRHEPPYWGAPGGTPPAPSFPPFLREEMGAPAAQARPRGAPITAGDHRSPLHRRPKLRIIRFRVNAKAHSLRWASSPHDDHSVGSPRGAPLGAPSRTPGHLLLPRWGNSPCRAPRMGRPPRRHPGTPHPPQCAHWGTFPPAGGRPNGAPRSPSPRGESPAESGRPQVAPTEATPGRRMGPH